MRQRILLLVSLGLCVSLIGAASVQAQQLSGHYTTVYTEGSVMDGGDRYAVTLALQADQATPLGSASLRLRFNPEALAPVSGAEARTALASDDYTMHAYDRTYLVDQVSTTGIADYSMTTATRPATDEVAVNIMLSKPGVGQMLPEQLTPVVTLYFQVLDATRDAELTWVVDGPNSSEAFDVDNMTQWQMGTFTGEAVIIQQEPEDTTLPQTFSLGQNYPNPFNPQTTITYTVPAVTPIHLAVYDLLGREVVTLVDEPQAAGIHTATFDARHLASGLYLYRLSAGSFRATRSMLVLK